jgi:diguanylate cyclase (GGDEF)-like protein
VAQVWLMTAATGVLALLLYTLVVREIPALPTGLGIPWWLAALLFYVSEITVVHLRFRRDAYSFSMSEVPLALCLFLMAPAILVPAQLLGSLAALMIHRRQPPLKLAFNISQFALQSCLGVLVFHMVARTGDPLGPAGWLAALLATEVAVVVAALLINMAIHLSGDRVAVPAAVRVLGLGMAACAMNASLGLVAVTILSDQPGAAWLALAPPVVLFIAYSAYTSKRRDHERLQLLYEATRKLNASPDIESVTASAAAQARMLLEGQTGEIILFSPSHADAAFSTRIGAGDETHIMEPILLDLPASVRTEVLTNRRGMVLRRPIEVPMVRGYIARRGFKDAVMAPLLGGDTLHGMVVVGNRLGDVSTFEHEDLKLLETLANHIAVALENGRLEDSLAKLTELKEELRHQAFHDALTSLPNRTLFIERVAAALARNKRAGRPLSVVFLDIDDFKTINDSLGHSLGDQVLVTVAERLRHAVRPGDTVARLGGDEFGVLLDDMNTPADALMAAERMMATLRVPAMLEGREVPIRASLGITLDAHGADAETLLRNADLAMYTAKRRGKNRYQVFETDMHTEMVQRLELSDHLRQGLKRNEFSIQYQPIIHLESGAITGVEALVRWNHPTRGVLRPAEFIHLAEETGLIVPLGQSILLEACRRARAWQEERAAGPAFVLSVNFSPKQVMDPALVNQVAVALDDSGLDPRSLVLEITEDVFLQGAEETLTRLRELKDLGVRLAIDDFGTGYSSLSYLERFPVDILKIAKPFVDGLGRGSRESSLVEAVIRIGDALGLDTVAEGIEAPEQRDRLRELRCQQGQGFYFARPLEHRRIKDLLSESNPDRPLHLVADAG